MGSHVFISYAHVPDAAYVERLAEHLTAAGLPVWFDKQVVAGDQWERVIRDRIDTCVALLVVMTPSAEASAWVAREIRRAEKTNKPIFPLLLEGQEFFQLGHLQYEDVAGGRLPDEAFLSRLRWRSLGTDVGPMRIRILIVGDDTGLACMVEPVLIAEGFDVVLANHGGATLTLINRHQPDLVILDLAVPEDEGVGVIRRLRAQGTMSVFPVIALGKDGQPADKVRALTAGADDYMVKPPDPTELVARIRATLRRYPAEVRDVSPLTGLPGSNQVLREIAERLQSGADVAVCYCDIDGFEAICEAYGYARGSQFVVTLADNLLGTAGTVGPPLAFVGHMGGDDFVVVCEPDQVLPLADSAISSFEEAADELYDEKDLERRYLTVAGRRHGSREVGLVTVSVGVSLSTFSTGGKYTDPRQMLATASEMMMVAKSKPGSHVAIDRRAES